MATTKQVAEAKKKKRKASRAHAVLLLETVRKLAVVRREFAAAEQLIDQLLHLENRAFVEWSEPSSTALQHQIAAHNIDFTNCSMGYVQCYLEWWLAALPLLRSQPLSSSSLRLVRSAAEKLQRWSTEDCSLSPIVLHLLSIMLDANEQVCLLSEALHRRDTRQTPFLLSFKFDTLLLSLEAPASQRPKERMEHFTMSQAEREEEEEEVFRVQLGLLFDKCLCLLSADKHEYCLETLDMGLKQALLFFSGRRKNRRATTNTRKRKRTSKPSDITTKEAEKAAENITLNAALEVLECIIKSDEEITEANDQQKERWLEISILMQQLISLLLVLPILCPNKYLANSSSSASLSMMRPIANMLARVAARAFSRTTEGEENSRLRRGYGAHVPPFLFAYLLWMEGQKMEALQQLGYSLAFDSYFCPALFLQGYLLFEAGKIEDSSEVFRNIGRISSGGYRPINCLNMMAICDASMNGQSNGEALAMFQTALRTLDDESKREATKNKDKANEENDGELMMLERRNRNDSKAERISIEMESVTFNVASMYARLGDYTSHENMLYCLSEHFLQRQREQQHLKASNYPESDSRKTQERSTFQANTAATLPEGSINLTFVEYFQTVAYLAQHKYAEAAERYRKLLTGSSAATLHLLMKANVVEPLTIFQQFTLALVKSRAYEEALRICNHVLSCYPDDIVMILHKASTLHSLGHLLPALHCLDQALALLSNHPATPSLTEENRRALQKQTHNNRAALLLRLNRAEEALLSLHAAASSSLPERDSNILQRATNYNTSLALWRSGKQDEACEHWLHWRQLVPSSSSSSSSLLSTYQTLLQRANSVATKQKDKEGEAERQMEVVILKQCLKEAQQRRNAEEIEKLKDVLSVCDVDEW